MEKGNVFVFILFSFRLQEILLFATNNMAESWGHYAKWNKLDRQIYGLTYIQKPKEKKMKNLNS